MKIRTLTINLTVTVGVIVLTALLVLIFAWINYHEHQGFGFMKDIDKNHLPTKQIVLAAFTMLGIFSRILFDEIKAANSEHIRIFKVVRKALASANFWLAISISPIVFGFVAKQFETLPDNASLGLMAYQNGFFFNSIFSMVQKNSESKARSGNDAEN